jgi:ABC-type polar amino acid transport system ATPase subunit
LRRAAARLRDFANSGIAMVVVEHLMGFIGEVTDRVSCSTPGAKFSKENSATRCATRRS